LHFDTSSIDTQSFAMPQGAFFGLQFPLIAKTASSLANLFPQDLPSDPATIAIAIAGVLLPCSALVVKCKY
jgi:hypothetical protein